MSKDRPAEALKRRPPTPQEIAVRDLLAKQDANFAVNQELATKDETIRALVAERDEANSKVEQLIGDLHAVSQDYTDAMTRIHQLERARDEAIELLTQAEGRLDGAGK